MVDPIPANRIILTDQTRLNAIFNPKSRVTLKLNDKEYSVALAARKSFAEIPKNTLWNQLMTTLGLRHWVVLSVNTAPYSLRTTAPTVYVKVNAASLAKLFNINQSDLKKHPDLDKTSLIRDRLDIDKEYEKLAKTYENDPKTLVLLNDLKDKTFQSISESEVIFSSSDDIEKLFESKNPGALGYKWVDNSNKSLEIFIRGKDKTSHYPLEFKYDRLVKLSEILKSYSDVFKEP